MTLRVEGLEPNRATGRLDTLGGLAVIDTEGDSGRISEDRDASARTVVQRPQETATARSLRFGDRSVDVIDADMNQPRGWDRRRSLTDAGNAPTLRPSDPATLRPSDPPTLRPVDANIVVRAWAPTVHSTS